MPHPRMYSDDDPHLDGMRRVCLAAERGALLGDPRFFPPWYWGDRGWVALNLETAPPDWAEVVELDETSYRQVALKRQLRALEA